MGASASCTLLLSSCYWPSKKQWLGTRTVKSVHVRMVNDFVFRFISQIKGFIRIKDLPIGSESI